LHKKSEASKRAYFTQLNGSIDTAMLLLKKGLPFHGHDESNESLNLGNFLEVYDCLADLGKVVVLQVIVVWWLIKSKQTLLSVL
jgi:pyruvate-formate lyase-activating enzyme